MTRAIPLNKDGLVVLVDDADYRVLAELGRWRVHRSGHVLYAARSKPGGGVLLMHQALTGWERTDHINGDGLDNRRANLRPATHAENMRNRRIQRNNTSGFKGVYRTRNGRWRARITVVGQGKRDLGTHATAEAAARAYDAAAVELFGEFARPNFTH
jgi:hypothetical protein